MWETSRGMTRNRRWCRTRIRIKLPADHKTCNTSCNSWASRGHITCHCQVTIILRARRNLTNRTTAREEKRSRAWAATWLARCVTVFGDSLRLHNYLTNAHQVTATASCCHCSCFSCHCSYSWCCCCSSAKWSEVASTKGFPLAPGQMMYMNLAWMQDGGR